MQPLIRAVIALCYLPHSLAFTSIIISSQTCPRRHQIPSRLHASNGDENVDRREMRAVSRASFLSISAATVLATVSSTETSGAVAPPSSASTRDTSTQSPPRVRDKKKEEQLEETISGFFSGGALTVTKTVVKYPLDSASVRLQMPGTTYSTSNLPELFSGSYRGILAPLLSNIPAGAVFFAVKDAAKSVLKEQGMPKWMSTMLAVLAAQGPYWVIRNPSEVIKTRQQAGVEGYGEGVAISDAFKLVTHNEGGKGLGELYSGYWENIIYAYPADVIKFLCYESLSGGRKNLPPAQGAVYGAAATAVAQLITTPLDVVRNRIMAGEEQAVKGGDSESGSEPSLSAAPSASYVNKLITLAREEGLEGLFAGATPRIGKALLSGAIQFATYEETKQAINRFLEEKFGGT